MNDQCTVCNVVTRTLNNVSVVRYQVPTRSKLLGGGGRNKLSGLAEDGSRLGQVGVWAGLCDECVARVVELVRSMQDFTAKGR